MSTKRYKRDLKEMERRRRKGMRMLARGIAQAEVARALGVSRQTTSSWATKLGEEVQARRSGDQDLAQQALAGAKKKSLREGRTIIFIDESGLSERPTRVKTWAPRGQTPVLQYSFNWKQLSVVAALSFWSFYFRFHTGPIRGPQFVAFLQALTHQIHGKLLVIWDGLPAHRSRLVKNFIEALAGHIILERLPAYAPELNPVEYLWRYMKQRELARLH